MEPVKQTGFLYKFDPRDYMTGASPLVIPDVNPTGDWKPWQPTGEKQYKYATFDTMSCTTFSALNDIETWVKWHRANNHFTDKQIATLNELGFNADGSFNCADRFTAIMSGTTPNGNYFQNVLDSIRKDGLLPEAILPFGGNSWNEYHNPALITQVMKDTAKKILDILDISYEWSPTNTINTDLKKCPIQGAIPETATHAVEIIAPGFYFDSYEPYVKPLPVVQYAMKIIVKVKPEVVPPPTYTYFKMDEKTDASGNHTFGELDPFLRTLCDKMRGECGFAWKITSGYRTQIENDATPNSVSDSAHVLRLAVDVYCVDSAKRDTIVNVAKANGIKRIGIGQNFVHLDIDKTKPQGVMWHYY